MKSFYDLNTYELDELRMDLLDELSENGTEELVTGIHKPTYKDINDSILYDRFGGHFFCVEEFQCNHYDRCREEVAV